MYFIAEVCSDYSQRNKTHALLCSVCTLYLSLAGRRHENLKMFSLLGFVRGMVNHEIRAFVWLFVASKIVEAIRGGTAKYKHKIPLNCD